MRIETLEMIHALLKSNCDQTDSEMSRAKKAWNESDNNNSLYKAYCEACKAFGKSYRALNDFENCQWR